MTILTLRLAFVIITSMNIDLHTHTIHSTGDGKQTLEQLLDKGAEQDVDYLSITDHNSIGAHLELNEKRKKGTLKTQFKGKLISGTELKFEQDSFAGEVLGYGMDVESFNNAHHPFMQPEEQLRRWKDYYDGLYRMFTKLGFVLGDYDALQQEYISAQKSPSFVLLPLLLQGDNLNISKKLISDFQGSNMKSKQNNWFRHDCKSPDGQFYVEREMDSLETISKAVRAAGGKVFKAHIFLDIKEQKKVEAFLRYATNKGLIDGLEVFYAGFTPGQIAYTKQYCEQSGLLMSGGTDNHNLEHKLCSLNDVSRTSFKVPHESVKWVDNVRSVDFANLQKP